MMSSFILVPLVVFGIGLVIFVHELGHYMAARWCGARVETFSLGFGPKLVGWERNGTLFQIAVVPLGGYVKVAGEYFDGTTRGEPGTLTSLSVWQRFLYYSGGVIMNLVFALVVMPMVMFAGLPAIRPIVGAPTPGMPAWEAGIPAGSLVTKVNGNEITDFEHLFGAVAVNGKNTAELEVIEPGASEPTTYTVIPRFDEEFGLYRLGLPKGYDPDRKLVVAPGTAAAEAGLTAEDRLIGVVGQPQALPLDAQLVRAFTSREPATLRVAGPDGVERDVIVTPKLEAADGKLIGVAPTTNRVKAVRTTGPASGAITALGLEVGDLVVAVQGERTSSRSDIESGLAAATTGTISLIIDRDGELLARETPLGAASPVDLLTDIAFEQPEESTALVVSTGSPAERAGLQDGDRIMSVNGTVVETWEAVLENIRAAVGKNFEVELLVYRDPDPVAVLAGHAVEPVDEIRLSLEAEEQERAVYGLSLAGATMTLRAESLGEAMVQGFAATKRFLSDVWTQLRKMLFSDEISTKNLGGIISISVISYDTASQGPSKLFFFLAILSINLAIINLLPIPILDGGHLLFLIIEAIKGSPVSERTFGYSQVVGLVMIMSLMVYVTYQDIVRWFIPPG